MNTEQMREALHKIKHEAVSLADAQVIALKALTQRPEAQTEREAMEEKFEAMHANGDVDDKLKANGGDPKDCSNAKVYGLRAATPESVGEPRCSTCGVTMDEPHHPACGAVTAAIIGLSTMAAQDKEARRRELAEKIRETLRGVFTRPAPGVPEGFVLVPVEPTWEMRIAASTAYREARDGHYTAQPASQEQ